MGPPLVFLSLELHLHLPIPGTLVWGDTRSERQLGGKPGLALQHPLSTLRSSRSSPDIWGWERVAERPHPRQAMGCGILTCLCRATLPFGDHILRATLVKCCPRCSQLSGMQGIFPRLPCEHDSPVPLGKGEKAHHHAAVASPWRGSRFRLFASLCSSARN